MLRLKPYNTGGPSLYLLIPRDIAKYLGISRETEFKFAIIEKSKGVISLTYTAEVKRDGEAG